MQYLMCELGQLHSPYIVRALKFQPLEPVFGEDLFCARNLTAARSRAFSY